MTFWDASSNYNVISDDKFSSTAMIFAYIHRLKEKVNSKFNKYEFIENKN